MDIASHNMLSVCPSKSFSRRIISSILQAMTGTSPILLDHQSPHHLKIDAISIISTVTTKTASMTFQHCDLMLVNRYLQENLQHVNNNNFPTKMCQTSDRIFPKNI
jgi:hypothetical protein